MKRVAIIINGDTEHRHLANVDRSLAVLRARGFETYVASTQNPSVASNHYVDATSSNIENLLKYLKSAGTVDELLIYTTGHGNEIVTKKKTEATLCLKDGCSPNAIAELMGQISYQKRVVVMDQCYSGNWGRRFTNDPRTLFFSGGSKGETVFCQEISPRFWRPDSQVPDINGDGVISWHERYVGAIGTGLSSSTSQFFPTEGYIQDGNPPFANHVTQVFDKVTLDEQRKRLSPGQYIVLYFSAMWCNYCKAFSPQFEALAQKSGGQHLFVKTDNEELAKAYGVGGYPSVMILSHDNLTYHVKQGLNALKELPEIGFSKTPTDLMIHRLDVAALLSQEEQRGATIVAVAEKWLETKLNMKDRIKVFDRMVAVALGITASEKRNSVLHVICQNGKGYRETEEQSVKLIQKISAPELRMDLWRRLSDYSRGAKARRYLDLAVALIGQVDRADYLIKLAELARVHRHPKTFQIFERALSVYRPCPTWDGDENPLLSLLVDLSELGTDAIPLLERAEVLIENESELSMKVIMLGYVADGFLKAGNRDQALLRLQRMTDLAEEYPDNDGKIASTLGDWLMIAGKMTDAQFGAEALALYQRSAHYLARSNNLRPAEWLIRVAGGMQQGKLPLDSYHAYLAEAEVSLQSETKVWSQIECLSDLAKLYHTAGLKDEALRLIVAAKTLIPQLDTSQQSYWLNRFMRQVKIP